MDRLDTWLNAQQGWRRYALVSLQSYGPSVLMVNAYLGWRDLPSGQPSQTQYAWLLALAIPCAAALAGPALLLRTASERRIRRRAGFVAPGLSWRVTGMLLLLASSTTLMTFIDGHSQGWKQQHDGLWTVVLILPVCSFALGLEGFRYARRIRRLAVQPAADPPFPAT